MSNDFSNIGFKISSREEVQPFVDRALREGRRTRTAVGSYVEWSPGAGARLWVVVTAEGKILGCIPEVETTAETPMRLTERHLDGDESGLTGDLFAEWGEVQAPFLFSVPDLRAYDDLVLPAEATVRPAASAQGPLDVFGTDAECSAATSFAAEAFIPSGLFLPGGEARVPPRAWAILYGHVLAGNDARTWPHP